MFKKSLAVSSLFMVLLSASSAHAEAIDVSSAVSGIQAAGVALLALIGALMSLSVTIFGITKVYRFLSKKSGA